MQEYLNQREQQSHDDHDPLQFSGIIKGQRIDEEPYNEIPTQFKKKAEELPDFVKDEIKLNDYENGLLKNIEIWIRKKQIENMK